MSPDKNLESEIIGRLKESKRLLSLYTNYTVFQESDLRTISALSHQLYEICQTFKVTISKTERQFIIGNDDKNVYELSQRLRSHGMLSQGLSFRRLSTRVLVVATPNLIDDALLQEYACYLV